MIEPPNENAPSAVPHTPGEPPLQPPTQPSFDARPDLVPPAQAPVPHPNQTQPPYGPYAPVAMPPAPPTRGNPLRTLLLVAVVLILVAGGGTAGYLLLGGEDDESGTAAEATTAAETSNAEPEPDASTEEVPEFEFGPGMMVVESVGAEVPVPSDTWELHLGPGEDGADLNDMSSYAIQYEEQWYANILIGTYNVAGLPYSPAEMPAIATELASFWSEQSAAPGENGTVTDPVVTEFTVDGHAAVIGEATASWDSIEFSDDTSERVIIFLVDVDGVNALYAQVWIPESADAEYEAVIAAFQATTFSE